MPTGIEIGLSALESALQVSGYQNSYIAIILLLGAVACFIHAAIKKIDSKKTFKESVGPPAPLSRTRMGNILLHG